jgi:hypothetical protein
MSEIREMSDSELDRAIALEVMGWHMGGVYYCNDSGNTLDVEIVDWLPTEDPACAFKVIERMQALKCRYMLRGNFEGRNRHWCGFDDQEWADQNPPYQSGLCYSMKRAICEAALDVVRKRKANAT